MDHDLNLYSNIIAKYKNKKGNIVVFAGKNGEIIGKRGEHLVFKITPAKIKTPEEAGAHLLSYIMFGNNSDLDSANYIAKGLGY